MREWIIAHTWKGEALLPEEQIRIRLLIHGDSLKLSVEAPFHGDPPPPQQAGSTDRLWEYEVVELFLVGEGGDYLEIEMGPYGHYLVLKLSDVRCVETAHLPMDFRVERDEKRWWGEARILRKWLPLSCIRANAFAIHGTGEKRRYLCAHAMGGKSPDFHQPACFPAFSSV